jgi:hypothetical protein
MRRNQEAGPERRTVGRYYPRDGASGLPASLEERHIYEIDRLPPDPLGAAIGPRHFSIRFFQRNTGTSLEHLDPACDLCLCVTGSTFLDGRHGVAYLRHRGS